MSTAIDIYELAHEVEQRARDIIEQREQEAGAEWDERAEWLRACDEAADAAALRHGLAADTIRELVTEARATEAVRELFAAKGWASPEGYKI